MRVVRGDSRMQYARRLPGLATIPAASTDAGSFEGVEVHQHPFVQHV